MIYKRGNVYWFKFVYNGVQYRGSTGLTNKAEAMRVEARKKTEIIMGKTCKEAPDFSKFVEEFLTWSQSQNKASTHKRYRVSSKPLLQFFRGKVSEDVPSVERFKVARLKECSTAGVNWDLAALRYMMNFAITLTMRYVHPTAAHKVEAMQKLRIFNGGHKSGHSEIVETVNY